jgi:hypothetical protein
VVGCLIDNPRNCSSNVFGQGLLVPFNGGSLGGDGVAVLVRVCWVSHGQFVLSHFRQDPDADSVKVTKFYY